MGEVVMGGVVMWEGVIMEVVGWWGRVEVEFMMMKMIMMIMTGMK